MAKHPLPPGPWLRFVLYWRDADTAWQNDLWYNVTSAGASTVLNSVLNDFATIVVADALPGIQSNAQLFAIKMYANNGTYTQSRVVYPSAMGTDAADALPVQVSIIGALNCEVATRQANGRIFIAGLGNDNVNGDYPSTAAITGFGNLLGNLKGFIESAGWAFALAVWDRKTAILHDVLDYAISGKMGSNRRRRPRV